MLQVLLRMFFNKFAGIPTLYIIDDCSATKELTKWDRMFYTKDRDSFENCLREDYVIPTLEERQQLKVLSKVKHQKLVFKSDQPTDYWIID